MSPPAARPKSISADEWAVRCDLAACYRLAALHGWTDSIATHISARAPGEESFLLNPYGMLFEEVTASSLVKVDLRGNILGRTDYAINPAGFVVHSAVHAVREDAGCVMHLHTDDGVAVSSLSGGLLPLNQTAMVIRGQVAYHDYEGVALDTDECERLGRDLGRRNLMILRNHGTLAVGANVPEAFLRMYLLERACTIQVRTLAMGRPIQPVTDEALRRTTEVGDSLGGPVALQAWSAHKRMLDRQTTDYLA